MGKKGMALLMAGMLVLFLSGCASNPDKSIVKEKNMDKMLEEAQQTEDKSSYEQVKEELKQYETYQTDIKDDKLKVSVHVDAKVEVPEVDKLSVYRASQKKINQDFLDSVRKALTPDVTYYEGSKTSIRTKADIAKDMRQLEEDIEKMKKSDPEGLLEEYQGYLAERQKDYDNAPDTVNLTDYPSDNKIQKVKQLYDSNPKDEFYSWLHELHGNGEVFYGVSDAKDGNFHSLYMQNCENYGNCLRYECGKNAYAGSIYHADVGTDISAISPWEDDKKPNFYNEDKGIDMPVIEEGVPVECVDNEPLTLSLDEAQGKAEALLNQVGLKDYACYEKGKFSQVVGERERESDEDTVQYRDIYRFLFLRKLDNVFVNNQAGHKMIDEWQGKDYVKKMWENEVVSVAVNDSGIVDFYYLSPLSIDETVVEKSNVKSFDEIKDTFEQMVVIENAPDAIEELKENEKVSIKVTDVRLVYTRISEKDSFDTGLIVPVWDFEGTVTNEYGMEKTGNILSINAIDGSVINRELGY